MMGWTSCQHSVSVIVESIHILAIRTGQVYLIDASTSVVDSHTSEKCSCFDDADYGAPMRTLEYIVNQKYPNIILNI